MLINNYRISRMN